MASALPSPTAGAAAAPATPARAFDAVLWDLDNTLLDTEALLDECIADSVQRLFGRRPSDEDLHAIRGLADKDNGPVRGWPSALMARMGLAPESALGGRAVTPLQLLEATEQVFAAHCTKARPMPGAAEAVARLVAAGVPQAIVTSSMREAVARKRVPHEESLFRHMRAIICVEDVEPRAKPHAWPYQLAAQRLGLPPARCVAVEDSLPGITSACAAGCIVVAVPLGSHRGEAARLGATLVLRSLEEWPLEDWLRGGAPLPAVKAGAETGAAADAEADADAPEAGVTGGRAA